MRYVLLLVMMCLSAEATPPNLLRELGARRRAQPMAQSTFPTNGLLTYWSMDSVSGDTVFDTFGSNNGTAVGSPLFGTEYGKHLEGINLNGSNQRIIVPAANSLANLDERTVSLWMNAETWGGGGYGRLIDSRGLSTAGITMALSENNTTYGIRAMHVVVNFSDNIPLVVTGDDSLWLGEWFHITYVLNSNGVGKVYINGNETTYRRQDTGSGSVVDDSARDIIIGAREDRTDRSFDGSLDEISIWNRALTSNEVSTIYNNGAGRFYTP